MFQLSNVFPPHLKALSVCYIVCYTASMNLQMITLTKNWRFLIKLNISEVARTNEFQPLPPCKFNCTHKFMMQIHHQREKSTNDRDPRVENLGGVRYESINSSLRNPCGRTKSAKNINKYMRTTPTKEKSHNTFYFIWFCLLFRSDY